MPEATSFNALGVGNGFPFCPLLYVDEDEYGPNPVSDSRVDVSVFPTWTTLGGYNSGSVGAVTEAEINLSRQRAMEIYWNIYQVNCELSAIDTGGGFPSNESITNITAFSTPRQRVCGEGMARFDDSVPFSRCSLIVNAQPLWLFNGDITDWDNFIGFSIGENIAADGFFNFIDATAFGGSTGSSSDLIVSCAGDGTLTTLSGYPFVCEADGDSVDEANFSVSSDDSGGGRTQTSSIDITSLDFFTYPA